MKKGKGGRYNLSPKLLLMREPTKQEYQSIIAHLAEYGTDVIQTQSKEPPWIVRNVNGFIYVVERMRENIVCTVLVPASILKNREISELESALEELNRMESNKYSYILKRVEEIPLITISAYYFHEEFDVQRDIVSLEHHALQILNEI